MDGSEYQFTIDELTLSPEVNPSIPFIYSAALADGSELPDDLIQFNADKRVFTV